MWLFPRHRWVLYPLLAPNSPRGGGKEEEKGRKRRKGKERERKRRRRRKRGEREIGEGGVGIKRRGVRKREVVLRFTVNHVCHEAMVGYKEPQRK